MSTEKMGTKQLFSNRFVQVILLSALTLQIGIWVRNFSVLLYVFDQTNQDEFAVSLISVAEFLPIFLFSFIGGTFADRWMPKRTMIWCDFLSAVSIFAVLATIMLGSWKAIFFATLVSSILSQFSQPSGMKLFKLHVPEELMQAGMAMYQTLFAIFMILGPVLGTFVYEQFGIQVSIAVTGVAFILSALILFKLPADRVEGERKDSSLSKEIKEGFQYVLSNKVLTTLGGCFLAAGLAIGIIQPLGVFLVTEQLGLAKEHLQWFMMANGIAMLLGGGVTLGISKKATPQILLMSGMVSSAITVLIMGFSKLVWLSLAMQFLSGLFMPAIQIGINTMIMKNTEHAFVGRVNGILSPLFIGAMVVTMSLSGLIKQASSLSFSYSISAIMFTFGVFVLLPLLRLPAASGGADDKAPDGANAPVQEQTT
jgi:MFS transporter, DHA3 family, macrolide efflux protein